MNWETRNKIIKDLYKESLTIGEAKGHAYADTEDSLANFKRNAEKLGLTPFQIWGVYCGKHLDSIYNAIKDNPASPVDKTEGLHGRIIDVITYMGILEAMLNEVQ